MKVNTETNFQISKKYTFLPHFINYSMSTLHLYCYECSNRSFQQLSTGAVREFEKML